MELIKTSVNHGSPTEPEHVEMELASIETPTALANTDKHIDDNIKGQACNEDLQGNKTEMSRESGKTLKTGRNKSEGKTCSTQEETGQNLPSSDSKREKDNKSCF